MDASHADQSDILNLTKQAEHLLNNAILMTEMGMDLKEKCNSGEKYVCYLRSLSIRASRTMVALQNSGKSFLTCAQKITTSVLSNTPITDTNIKLQFEKLLAVIERELSEIEDLDSSFDSNPSASFINVNVNQISEKIKYLEAKQKVSDSNVLPTSNSCKSVKSEVDEKYPSDNWSKESLIDLNSIMNLPPVPEDIFTSFSKPTRTSSLSSLKSMRKVKLFLQRAANTNSDEDEESEFEEKDYVKLVVGGDSDEIKSTSSSPHYNVKKATPLSNIKEETPQD